MAAVRAHMIIPQTIGSSKKIGYRGFRVILYTLARNTFRDPMMKLLLLTALQISVSCFEHVVRK